MIGKNRKWNKWLRNSGQIMLITMLMLVGVEGVLRLFWGGILGEPEPENLAFEYHPAYLVKLRPNVEKQYIRSAIDGGDTIIWRTNSDGFRGAELLDTADLRIMVYGDSNIQARFSSLDRTYAQRLAYYLSQSRERQVEVINAGVVGFGPDQSLLKMKEELDHYRPDWVILHVFTGNDYGDLIRNRLFELDETGALRATSFETQPDRYLVGQSRPPLYIVRMAKHLARRLLAPFPDARGAVLVKRMQSRCQQEFQVYQKGLPLQFTHFGDHYEFDLALHPHLPSSQIKVSLMDKTLRAVQKFLKTKGVRLLVLIQPSPVDASERYFLTRDDLGDFPAYRPAYLTSLVDSICAEADIPRINLYPLFHRRMKTERLFLEDGHWNDKGQDLAAKETVLWMGEED